MHDNGIGISEKDRQYIFEKFERASAFKRSRLGKVAGFGLGLNYVYQVMDAHDGSVTVNSVEKEFSSSYAVCTLKSVEHDADWINDLLVGKTFPFVDFIFRCSFSPLHLHQNRKLMRNER